MGPSLGMDGCGKSRSHRDSIPGLSSPYRVALLTTLFWPTISKGISYKNFSVFRTKVVRKHVFPHGSHLTLQDRFRLNVVLWGFTLDFTANLLVQNTKKC